MTASIEEVTLATMPPLAGRLRGLWNDLRTPILVFLAIRIFLSAVVYFASPALPPSPIGTPWQGLPGLPLLDPWARWDSGWYAGIAQVGYKYFADQASNVAFLPAYPLVVKAFDVVFRNVWIAGIVASNLLFLAALIALHKLAALKLGRAAANRTILCLGVFPATFFFYSMYSESLYLLCVVMSFYLWEKRQDWPAGVFGAVAALTRPMGILLFLSGMAKHLLEGRSARRFPPAWRSASTALIPLALGGFLVYSYFSFGDPLAFLHSRNVGWNEPVSLLPASHRELLATLTDGSILHGKGPALRLLDTAAGMAFLVLSIPVFRRLGPSYGLYSLGSVVMPLLVNLDGLTRYVSVIFPVFMLVGLWATSRAIMSVLSAVSLALMGYLATLFANWYFAG